MMTFSDTILDLVATVSTLLIAGLAFVAIMF